jgi:hypothetical protein
MKSSNQKRISLLAVVATVVLNLLPVMTEASQLTSRSVALGSSSASTLTAHTIAFTIPTTGNVGSILFSYCTTATGACTVPTGLITTSAALAAQSGAISFSLNATTNGAPYVTRGPSSVVASTAVAYTLNSITNPSATNTTFWVRITTYASSNTTGGSTDAGVVAATIATGVVISGYMPESLVFCVGTAGTNCTNMSGSTINLGIFSPLTTVYGSSIMSASTNAATGYAITVAGPTLTSGSNTITPMGTQSLNSSNSTASAIGTSQFGMNIRQNTTPVIGSDVTGLGSGAGVGGYNNPNNYRFFSGDTVATTSVPTKDNLYTSSYIVNVSPDQAAGTYSSTITYICTGLF